MTLHHHIFSDPIPTFGPAPTWQEVYTYWQSHAVPQIEVVEYDPEVHDEEVPWFEKNQPYHNRRGFFHYLQGSPRVGTAYALAMTATQGGPVLYAAFALVCALRELDESSPLKLMVRGHLNQISPDLHQCWHTNAKRVLPVNVEEGRTFYKNRDWHLRVDLASMVWRGLATKYQVVRLARWK